MDRDDFIIAVFLIVCEQYQVIEKTHRLRHGGFPPALRDEEVITKGFIDAFRQALLAERHGIRLVTPPRKGMTMEVPKPLLTYCQWVRKFVETVGSHLTDRFGIERFRVHDLWHFQCRLIRKILAHTVCVFLNLLLGRPPLDLDGLASA